MLGSRVALELAERQINFSQISRGSFGDCSLGETQALDIATLQNLEKVYGKPTHIINAIGVVKPRIDEAKSESVLNAIQGNSLFPATLVFIVKAMQCISFKLQQIVFTLGKKGII